MFKSVASYYETKLGQNIELLEPNITAIVRDIDANSILAMVELVICLAVQSERRQVYIQKMQMLDMESQTALMHSIESTINAIQNGPTAKAPMTAPGSSNNSSPEKSQASAGGGGEDYEKLFREKRELEAYLKTSKEALEKLKKIYQDQKAENLNLQKQLQESEAKAKKAETSGQSEVVLKTEISTLRQKYEKCETQRLDLEHQTSNQIILIEELKKKVSFHCLCWSVRSNRPHCRF